MFKKIIDDLRAGFEDGPHLFCLYNDFPLFFLVLYVIMFAVITIVIAVLSGILFFAMLTLSSSMDSGLFALSSVSVAIFLALWFLLKYATRKLWIISLKRHPFLRFPCPPS
jgi:hypothetical protein